ncbi:MAG TPA: SCP2 sterol-binding domain-containing protein [Polyangiaceae bacterium]|nr:SCP2 sterol-binding domain-containing protein [Polyangiaceae bacterium]
MAVDIPKLFNEQLPSILAKNADEAKTINATYQMNITGAGSWHLDLTKSGPTVTPGEKPADCTVTLSSEDFEKLKDNPAAGPQLFFSGRLKVAGNPMLGMKLQKLFSLR